MANALEIRVPNIGDFQDVPIVAVLVKPGDTLRIEDPLVEIESDKATMEVPSPVAGVVESVVVKVGDRVSEGSAILTLAAGDVANATEPEATSPNQATPEATPSNHVPDPSPPKGTPPQAVAPAPAAPKTELIELRVPDIGDFADIPVIDVLVSVGDRVERESPLVTLESEKASMDVPATSAGIVREVILKVGDRVSQGSLVALIDGVPAGTPVTPPPSDAPSPPPAAAAVVPQATPVPTPTAPQPAALAPATVSGNGIVHASPSIRRFARELGVDLQAVRGSGPHERITREDVQAFVKTALAAPPPSARPGGGAAPFDLPPWPKVDFAKFGPVQTVPLSRIRKLSGPNLHRNWVSIPHVTNNDEADITDLEAFRKKLNAENPAAKVTMLAFVMKAAVVALRAHPEVNSSLDGDGLVLKQYYNLGFAADTPGGLMVPVIKGVDTKGVLALAAETAALAARARDGKLALADMQGATFTISSLGGIGGTSFTPIINAPEVAILGLSRAAMRPLWDGSAFVPRLMLPLSLSFDHRVIDGALAARFNATLAATLGDLRRALL